MDDGPGYLTAITSSADLATLQREVPGIKYLARVARAEPPAPLVADCYFQNMRRYRWHIDFLLSFPELANLDLDTYENMVLKAASRTLWGGEIRLWPGVAHPQTERAGVLSYAAYSDYNQALSADEIVEIDQRLKQCLPFAQDLLVFVPAHERQIQQARAIEAELVERGVAVLYPEDLLAGLASESYSHGVGYGYLHVVASGQSLGNYGPRDVVIADSAPHDISIVSGLITADPQNLHSHVNLRLQEKGIPNAAVPDIQQNALVKTFAGHLVKITVSADQVELAPATLAAAEAHWASTRPVLPPVRADLSATAIAAYDIIDADDALAYGAKAANLAELHDLLPAPHRVEGLAIPFSAYSTFIAHNQIDRDIAALLADDQVKTDAYVKRQRLQGVRAAIAKAPLEPGFFAALQEQLIAVFGAEDAMYHRIRFRSSTNVEDLDVLTGAGLYDSKSGCLADDLDGDNEGPSHCLEDQERHVLEQRLADTRAAYQAHPERIWLADIIDDIESDLSKEKPIARAVKRVWASLWNERAFDERDFYAIDHTQVYMGIAVNRSFVLEQVNAVAVTNLTPDAGLPLYRVVSQVGWESVVRPDDPTAVAEVLTFRRDGTSAAEVTQLLDSSLAAPGTALWSHDNLADLAGVLFTVQDHFANEVFTDLKPARLDTEFKIDRHGNVVIKQVRPYITQ